MALTFNLVDKWDDGKRIHLAGTVSASGNYSTGGDTLDLSQIPILVSTQLAISSTSWMDGLAGYDYIFAPGSALNSNKVKIFWESEPGEDALTELAAGAYPQAILDDNITLYLIAKKRVEE